MKKLLAVIVGVAAIVFTLSFFKDMLVKTAVEKGVKVVTGLRLKIGGFNLGIINTLVGIEDLKLYNPAGFQEPVMLDMPEIYVDYNLPSFFQGNIHLEEMRIDMKEFMVVRNKSGALNLDSLKVVQAHKEGKKPGEKTKTEAKMPKIQIDNLQLKIGKVVYKDYSKGGSPSVREFNVNLNEKYKDITDPYSLVSLIVVKALMNTSIANLTNFDLRGLQNTVSDTLAGTQKIATEAAKKARETITATTQTTQKAVKETAETLQKTTEGLKDVLGMPFGAKKE